MANWEVVVTKEAESDLESLDAGIRRRVLEKIEWLSQNFDLITPLPLGATWRGFFKLRVGDWRVVYQIEIEKKTIVIHYTGHRNKIYKRQK
jgi:mRNA interferase RelE/StbE